MPTKKAEWYIVERVHALAVMHLTRRSDLVVRDVWRDPHYLTDLTVEIIEPGKIGRRRFGVYVEGTKTAIDDEHSNKQLDPSVRQFSSDNPLPDPICLFYFSMEGDQGYFTWIKEPVIVDGTARLRIHHQAHGVKLDRKILDRIVQQVNDWYDAFYASVVVN
jgi:hypothetical protein